jgi:hypothetical protein
MAEQVLTTMPTQQQINRFRNRHKQLCQKYGLTLVPNIECRSLFWGLLLKILGGYKKLIPRITIEDLPNKHGDKGSRD